MMRVLGFVVGILLLFGSSASAAEVTPSVKGTSGPKGKTVELTHVYAHREGASGEFVGVLVTDTPLEAKALAGDRYRKVIDPKTTQGLFLLFDHEGRVVKGSLYHPDQPRTSFADFSGKKADGFAFDGKGVKIERLEWASKTLGGWSFSVAFEAPVQ